MDFSSVATLLVLILAANFGIISLRGNLHFGLLVILSPILKKSSDFKAKCRPSQVGISLKKCYFIK